MGEQVGGFGGGADDDGGAGGGGGGGGGGKDESIVVVVLERWEDGRLPARRDFFSTRESELPWRERGGVRGCERSGRSVGRRAAGMYCGCLSLRALARLRL